MMYDTASQSEMSPKISLGKVTSYTIFSEIKSFLIWWYLEIPSWYIAFVKRVILICDDSFSISLLIKTFTTPWRLDRSPVGYFVGIIVRILYLPVAIVVTLTFLLILFIFAIVWAIVPVATCYYLIKTLFLF